MLSQIKKIAAGILTLAILSLLLCSCSIRLKHDYDYSSETNVLTTTVKIFSTNTHDERMVGWLMARNDTIFWVLQFQFSRSDHKRFQVPAGEYLSLNFTDGTNIGLMNSADVTSDKGMIMGDMERIVDVYIPLSPNDMKTILSKDIVYLNLQSTVGQSRFDMKPRKAQALKKMIALMRPDLLK